MPHRSSRLKGFVVIFASCFMAISICAIFYYFKIRQNENYQNQLHFRELRDINTAIDNGLGQLNNLAVRKHVKEELERRKGLRAEGTALKRLKIVKSIGFRQKKFIFDHASGNLEMEMNGALLAVPFSDFTGDESKKFPLVLLVNESGLRFISKENRKLDSSLVGNNFQKLDQILGKIVKLQNNGRASIPKGENPTGAINSKEKISKLATPGYSEYVDVEISGIDYRVYVSPYINSRGVSLHERKQVGDVEKVEQLYLIGFRAKSELTSAKLNVSKSLVAAAVLFFVLLLAFVPILKIRLVSAGQAFSSFDRNMVSVGAISGVVVLSVSGFDYFEYSRLKEVVDKRSRSIFFQMRNRFNDEIRLLDEYAQMHFDHDYSDGNCSNLESISNFDRSFLDKGNSYLKGNGYFLENLFYLCGGSSLEDSSRIKGVVYWSTKKLNREKSIENKKPKSIDLSSREYARRALLGNLWPVKFPSKDSKCHPGLYIQRLFNLGDGRLSTQFSRSCNKKYRDNISKVKHSQYNDVLSYGTKLQTFFNAVLPVNFGFVVFENETGMVLYHIDDKNRSLLENVYVETDNHPLIKAVKNSSYFHNQPITFDAIYSGKMHHFSLGAVHPDIPWTLAIFYSKDELRTVNLMSVLVALFLSLMLMLTVYLISSVLVPKSLRRSPFWPPCSMRNSSPLYDEIGRRMGSVIFFPGLLRNYLKRGRLSVIFGAVLWSLFGILFVVFVSILISYKVFDYFENRYGQVLNSELSNSIYNAKMRREKYRSLVIDNVGGEGPFSFNLGDTIPCYLGTKNPPENKFKVQTCSLNDEQGRLYLDREANGVVDYESSIVEFFLKFIYLDHDIDEALIVTAKLDSVQGGKDRDDDEKVDGSLNLHAFDENKKIEVKYKQVSGTSTLSIFLSLIGGGAFLVVVFVVVYGWVFKRFLGFSLSEDFRLGQRSSEIIDYVKSGYFKEKGLAQVIRPTLCLRREICHPCANSEFSSLHPVRREIIDVATWFDGDKDSFQADIVVNKLFSDADVSLPLCVPRILYLEGFEAISGLPDCRTFVLDVLERLICMPKLSVLVFCEVAPLYMLTNQREYPQSDIEKVEAQPIEVIRWSNIFRKFNKIYDWNMSSKLMHDRPSKAGDVLMHEALGWPELLETCERFLNYHGRVKSTDSRDAKLIQAISREIRNQKSTGEKVKFSCFLFELEKSLSRHWSFDQIIEFFSSSVGALYRHKWSLCTKSERLLLYQMAHNCEPNPLNRAPIEHLARRGYIYQDRGWHLINESFRRFILSAEPDKVMAEWIDEASDNIWRYFRIPFFALLIALLAILAYSATDTVETSVGILTGIMGLIPLAVRNFAYLKE